MNALIQQAIVQLHRWAREEDARRRDERFDGRAAPRAALLRKCAQELVQCQDNLADAREVLCRYAVTGRDESAARLNALAASLRLPGLAAANEPAYAPETMLGEEP